MLDIDKDLYPHQRTAVDDLSNGKILWGGVGSGKSRTSVAYYVKNEAPKDVYVITTARKRDSLDWEGEFARYGIGREHSLYGKLRVDSWNNVANYKNVRNAFFIFDEQRIVGSGAWSKAFMFIAKRNHWILLTATPGDTWLDYMPVFIANGFYFNKTHFKDEHVVYSPYTRYPKVDHYLDTGKLERLRDQLLVEMPYLSHTTRVAVDVVVEFDEVLFDRVLTDRWNPYEGRPIKDSAELFKLMRRVAYSDPSRLIAVKELMGRHPRLIIFYNFDYELEALRTLSADITVAEWNGHKHQEVPETDRWLYLVHYVAGAEAWNCTTTDATIFYSMTYSYKNWHQAHGRIDRMDTPFSKLFYYRLLSNSFIDKAVSGALKRKKSFNENRFVAKMNGPQTKNPAKKNQN